MILIKIYSDFKRNLIRFSYFNTDLEKVAFIILLLNKKFIVYMNISSPNNQFTLVKIIYFDINILDFRCNNFIVRFQYTYSLDSEDLR